MLQLRPFSIGIRVSQIQVCRTPTLWTMPSTRRTLRATSPTADTHSEEPPLKRARRVKSKQVLKKAEVDGERDKSPSSSVSDDTSEFLPRVQSAWKVGAHVSAAGGVENAVRNAAMIGANAFALFLKSQRKWVSPALTEESITTFKANMKKYNYSADVVLPHGNYLINLGNPDADKREKSYECFVEELKRCELLGLKLYNFHPGSTVGVATKDESVSCIAECINRAHEDTKFVVTVIENMAGAGNTIGSEFSELRKIIDQVKDKSRVGVCLDTCHLFAAGYDLRKKQAWDETISKFDKEVGLSYLRGMHLNDSKVELNSKKDRHENIGVGFLGTEAFRNILNDVRVQNIPLILETPNLEQPKEVWGKEIAMLQRLSNVGSGD